MARNKHDLSRNIPAKVKRKVREQSKYGCVICRSGFYQYEHIAPFEDVKAHDPEHICCLCGRCHDAVTRGHLSKEAVVAAYSRIRGGGNEVEPPTGPLDFHAGFAAIRIGGLEYPPTLRTLVRYHGTDVVTVMPGSHGSPGRISAIFTDDDGHPILELRENEWVGQTQGWDIEVIGKRLTVRKSSGETALVLRMDFPGTLVLERLDMRIGDAHLIVGEQAYAVGRYVVDGTIFWVHANLAIPRTGPNAVAIEFTEEAILTTRLAALEGKGQYLQTDDGNIMMGSPHGCVFKRLGISIAYQCALQLYKMAAGTRPIRGVRDVVWNHPQHICEYLGVGTIGTHDAGLDS